MFMKKPPIILAVLFVSLKTFAQETPLPTAMEIKLPVVTPASPEATAINMNGQLSVGLVSGGAQASIPLYDVKVGSLSVPISFNYSSTGTKVDEVPSRVGMNWVFSPSGVVSRIMHGKADDQAARQQPYAGFPNFQNALYDYAMNLSDALSFPAGGYELEPDEFRYNAPGIAGKFIIKDDGSILQIPHSNNKIEIIGGPWNGGGQFTTILVTNTAGVKYTFGSTGAIENTLSISNGQYSGSVHSIRTAFFLKRIQNPQGDFIDFNYSPKTFSVTTGKSNSLTQVISQTGTPCTNTSCIVNSVSFHESISTIVYQSVYLSSLTTSDGQSVTFQYEERPDNSDDVRLTGISILAGNFSKSYYLKYDFYYTGAFYLSRYYLKEVGYITATQNPYVFDTVRYTMSYINPESVAARLSYSQDHWGYYNGQANTSFLTPYPDQVTNTYSNADRNSYANYAIKGMLNKVTFPTGGYQEFEYEGNSIAGWTTQHTMATATGLGSGDNIPTNDPSGTYQTLTYYSQEFTPPTSQGVNLAFTTFANPGCSLCSPPIPNTMTFASFEIRDLTTNTVLVNGIGRTYTVDNFFVYLQANNRYKIKITVSGLPNAARAELTYDATVNPITNYQDIPAPGVRVKRIGTYEPLTAKLTNKYYRYGKIGSPQVSTGLFMMAPIYWYDLSTKTPCGDQNHPSIGCLNRFVSSVPQNNLFILDGLQGGYSTVIEADDPNLANGGIEHNFLTVGDNQLPTTYYNDNPILTTPINTRTFLQNEEVVTNVFNSTGSIIKQTQNWLHVDTSVNNQYHALTARQRVNHYTVGMPSSNTAESAGNFGYCYDLNGYDYISNWIQQDSTVEIEYASNGTEMRSTTAYYYGNSINTSPVKTEVKNSLGDIIAVESKYPTDYTVLPYTKMVSNNVISATVETQIKMNGAVTNKSRTDFFDWFPSGTNVLIGPKYIYTTNKANPEELRVQYLSYDDHQNVRELSKANGVHISYIWDYNKEFPIAEIQNGSLLSDSIAYTSFESDGRGGWNVPNGGTLIGNNPPTGNISYSLDIGGSITRTILSSKSYSITYWLKNASGTAMVNGNSGTALVVKNGWTCYQQTINSASLITISGTGTIDELRLYPMGSLMKTITYKPFFGVSSECDANNRISYYEYDDQARLALVRDADRNVLKKICYKLAGQTGDCPINLSADGQWSPTGQTRCQLCPANPNYLSGITEREEVDINPSSPTYNMHRWVIYSGGSCVAAAQWVNTGTTYCQLNNNGENTGYFITVQRDVNPCSGTYNQLREVSIYNPSACPVCSTSCSSPSQKCINGNCVTGTWAVVYVEQIHNNEWLCTYSYCFPDGSISSYRQQVSSSSPCKISCGTSD
jgi:hypothetical protein